MEFATIVALLLLAFFFRHEFRRIEEKVAGATDGSRDDVIDAQVAKATQSLRAHQEKLLTEKKQLPGMELWDIAAGNWEAQLIAKAEQLRPLAEEAYGYSPDTWNFMQHAHRIPMTFNYAHALAGFATTQMDINIKTTEWKIKRVVLLGLMKKQRTDFAEVAYSELELKELEREIGRLEGQLGLRRKEVCDAVLDYMQETLKVRGPDNRTL